MAVSRERVVSLVVGGVLVTACSASSSGAAPAAPMETPTTLAGDPLLTFTPTLVSAATAHEQCACGGGPLSYDAVEILLTDDPRFDSLCDQNAANTGYWNTTKYRYLAIQVIGGAAAGGTFDVAAPGSPGTIVSGNSAQVIEEYPLTPPTHVGVASQGGGTVTLGALSTVVAGKFDVSLDVAGSAQPSALSGSFSAKNCGTIPSVSKTPCGQCAGFGSGT